MFVRLEEQLEPYADQVVTLFFEKAGEVEITFMVEESNRDYKMDMDHRQDNQDLTIWYLLFTKGLYTVSYRGKKNKPIPPDTVQ